MPHGRIIRALAEAAGDNRLVRYFHTEQGTLCRGCHHNAPASRKPPACSSCHAKPFDEKFPDRPGLMAAYHRQCMTCHRTMGLEKPPANDCQACHLEKTGLDR